MAESSLVANSPAAAVDVTTKPVTTTESKEPAQYEVTLPPQDVLRRLALQLEYYFSEANLSKDTYLRTLRDLNDGYVLASILANFAKIQALCPVDSFHAVVEAAREHSEKLEVVLLHKETSKRVDEEDGKNTLLAIGPIGSKPIASIPTPSTPETGKTISTLSSSSPPPASPSPSSIQNTVILREVAPGVTEEEIRSLFDDAPPIRSIHEDVACCWFVTFDTTSRDDMLRAMMSLRMKDLRGEPVKARLKSGVAAPVAPVLPSMMGYNVYAGDRNLPYSRNNHNSNGNHRAKKGQNHTGYNNSKSPRSPNNKKMVRRNRSSSNGNSNNNSNQNQSGINKNSSSSNSGNELTNNSSSSGHRKSRENNKVSQPAPELVESHFPALVDTSTPIKDDDEKSPASDGASTATTNSTSSSATKQQPQLMSGYAAALLKAPTPEEVQKAQQLQKDKEAAKKAEGIKKVENGTKIETGKKAERRTKANNKEKNKSDDKRKKMKDEDMGAYVEGSTVPAQVVEAEVVPLAWGGGKSFADILKKEESAEASS